MKVATIALFALSAPLLLGVSAVMAPHVAVSRGPTRSAAEVTYTKL